MSFAISAHPHHLPVVFDELGLEAYVPVYPLGANDPARVTIRVTTTEEAVTPWSLNLSSYDARKTCPAWTHLFSDRFLSTVEGAFRIAIMGLMPATILLYSKYDDGSGPWKSQSLIVIGSVIAFLLRCETMGMYFLYIGVFLRSSAVWLPILVVCTTFFFSYDNGNGPWKSTSIIIIGSIVSFLLRCETIGSYLAYVGTMLRASVIWVPILVVATRIQLYNHIAASFVVFAAVNLLAATFMEGVCRKLTMVFFTIMFMDLLRTRPLPGNEIRYVHLWAELALGTCFGMLSTVLPWPTLSSHHADAVLGRIARGTSTALRGLAESFWADSNLTRNVRMTRVRSVLVSLEGSIADVRRHLVGSEHEWMFQSPERRRLRLLKVELCSALVRNLASIRRIIDIDALAGS
ncbi:transmembrane protein, putative [Bodo saltans]|uniref:Transmembrane protein, putative n=1 Tax=Bodo saltans TaxID=75058 RepID=A0A0S4IM19_BODSA|nr:transmembrane protein, putative [Bodo saltans]|eukprot:CUE72648.1 transmembrane protein, putative [Bodo saltans]